MGKRQIINPLVGFGQRSIGPYANRIGGSTYARATVRGKPCLVDLFKGVDSVGAGMQMRKGLFYLWEALDVSLDRIAQYQISDGVSWASSINTTSIQQAWFGASSGISSAPGPGFAFNGVTDFDNQAQDYYGNNYVMVNASSEWIRYTSPSGTTDLLLNTYLRPEQGGIGLVTIDGDTTLANELRTAQEMVDAGDLDPSALVGGGGTLNPTDRVVDCYAADYTFNATIRIAKNLSPGAHVVQFDWTGYFNTASAGGAQSRINVAGMGTLRGTEARVFADILMMELVSGVLNPIQEGGSVFEYAILCAPTAGGAQTWVGNSHGQDDQVSIIGLVDGADTVMTEYTQYAGTASVGLRRVSELQHPDNAGKIGDATCIYTTTDRLEVQTTLSFLVALTSDRTYTVMHPVVGGNVLGSVCGAGVNYDLTKNDGEFHGKIDSGQAYMWANGGKAAVLTNIPDLGAAVNDYVDAQGLDLSIEDRADGTLEKIYATRLTDAKPIAVSEVWDYSAEWFLQEFSSANGVLAGIAPGGCPPCVEPEEPAPSAQLHAFGADSNGVLKGLVKGDGDLTFARATEATVTDFEGLGRTALVNELRFLYGRRVENLYEHTEAFENAYWEKLTGTTVDDATTDVLDPDGGNTATQVVYDGLGAAGDHRVRPASDVVVAPAIGRDFATSYWLKAETGTIPLRITNDFGDSQNITVITTWQRFSALGNSNGTDYAPTVIRHQSGENDPFTCYVWHPQAEEATGQANQNPSEYVSVDVLSGDYHGVGVDGVACFDHENGNTVSSNVVTEAKGADLTTAWRALYEPFATTNYALGDDDLSGGAETVDLTSPGTGDYTLSVGGTAAVTVAAGTATGTGFGQATDGSPVTFNLTVAGTVTLTLDSGTLDKWDGLAQKQVEKASVASSWVPTSGSAATRSADDGAPSFAYSNWSQVEGTWIADVWFSAINTGENNAIFNLHNSIVPGPMYENGGAAKMNSGVADNVVALSPAIVNNRFRISSNFETGGTMQIGMRDVDGEGSFSWGAEGTAYDGDFHSNNVFNIAFNGAHPLRIRDLYGYKVRLGKDYIEENF